MDFDWDDEDERVRPLGTVVESGRGSLPFALVHGEALVVAASWALGEAGVTLIDVGTEWSGLVDAGAPLVLHDALCPMTPTDFLVACLERAAEQDVVVVGTRPVTDTVKETAGGFVGATVDRAGLVAVASPVVLPASVVARLDGLPSLDFVELVEDLRARFPVELADAPPSARRVAGEDDVRLLEALTTPER
ncbi:2-C-methyl-D-erythritol 4-phosphate cytidylyltransferase [Nocardioides sp. SOB77]|uniref:2-C-methyl-D-erythritol 4-phosphate cytidylyltransferase n=1 Tax=Nocardioides oceani TaxID=3058369 RepID=A0ABT8FJ03_9ACTN|nr:2-C-methyl-D-erythritol 4-phosphate cytidylyltransferase [Nocardioides oceani]MDN4174584.1 2-C-methyl-D-erythritol 4-phosphate cytidylyltransferase [Nocardioides oceani]